MKLAFIFLFINISLTSLGQSMETFYDFKPCYNSKEVICSMNAKSSDELIRNGITYRFNYDESFAFVKFFNNKNICIGKGQYKMYEIDTIKTFRVILSEGITNEIITGTRKVFYKEGTWFSIVKGKLDISYFQKGRKIISSIPNDN